MPHALAIRHVGFEDLGSLEEVLADAGYRIEYADAGVDDLASADFLTPSLLVVLGGPIGAYEEDIYPFLRAETAGLRERLAAGKRTLGICLGAQLMAAALGGRVYPGSGKELGWSPLQLTAAGAASPLRHLDGLPVLHWHGDTFTLPPGAELLGSTSRYPHQVFAMGRHALAFQCHPEVTARGLERWFIAHAAEIRSTEGVSVPALRSQTAQHAPALAAASRELFREWLAWRCAR